MVRIRIGGEELTLTWDDWEQRVRRGQVAEDTEVQFEPVTGDQWVLARDLEMYTSLRETAILEFRDLGIAPIATALLVGLNIRLWWAQEWVIPIEREVLGKCLAAHAPIMEDGEGWRLLTMGFCHVDFMHIAMNMMWLAMAGWGIERVLGRANLITLFMASVLFGSLLTILFAPETAALGASGGVYGCVTAVVVFGFFRPHLLSGNYRGLYGIAMLPYLLLMFWNGLNNDSVANWAHFGGIVAGGSLALFLDPVQLQRRPGWNAIWQGLVGALTVICLIVPAIAGPQLHVLIDDREARSHLSRAVVVPRDDDKKEPYRPLVYGVPAGWTPRINSAGDPAFSSPVWDTHRSWSVSGRSEERPTTPEVVLERWRNKVVRGWPDAQWSEPEPRPMAGWDGLAITVEVGDGDETRILEWWATSRGVHTLQVVWEVDVSSAARLRPLRDRLTANIEWKDPKDLHNAHIAIAHRADSRLARSSLARAVGRTGDGDQSIELWLGLIAEDSTKRDYWDGLFETLQWYPHHRDAEALWNRALAERPTPRTTAHVAKGLDAAGRAADADGLLDLAWANDPGDRILKRARRGRNQSTALDADTHLPWERVHDPVDGTRLQPADAPETLTLEAAAARGVELRAQSDRIEAAAIRWIDSEAEGMPIPLLFLRFGEIPADLPEALEALAKDIERVVDNATPNWLPEPVTLAIRAERDLADRVRALAKAD